MSLTKVSPALIQVANNVTSTTIGNTTSIPSLTFDASGVIISASNTTVTVSNTNITGNITSSQIVPNPVFNGNTTVTNIIVGAGSNTAPSISTISDPNTGIFFPAADTIAFAEGGAEAMRIDSNGNVGIGTTSPTVSGSNRSFTLNSPAASGSFVDFKTNETLNFRIFSGGANSILSVKTATPLIFDTNDTERMRIASDGAISAGSTTVTVGLGVFSNFGSRILDFARYADDGATVGFRRGATVVGTISVTGSATAYNTSSDYRLKENIAPMTGALDLVQQLKPVTYNWKVDGSSGQGFIAHELQAVVPDCVTGEKDAVETYTDEDGVEQTRIKPQGIDTSFLVATLTAAIQELKAINDAQAQTIESLTARVAALEAQ